jgi:hypothetical protein
MVCDQTPQVSVREVTAREAVPLLARAARWPTTDETLDHLTDAGRNFVVEQDGKPVFAYTLAVHGRECYVLAAAGAASFDLTAFGLALIEAHAHGLDTVAFQTRRKGLIRKAARHGYAVAGRAGDGTILRKELQ